MRIPNFSTLVLAATLLLGACSKNNDEDAQPDMVVPADPGPQAPSASDRVYTSDQSSNTVSVHDPNTNRLLGVIRLVKGGPSS